MPFMRYGYIYTDDKGRLRPRVFREYKIDSEDR